MNKRLQWSCRTFHRPNNPTNHHLQKNGTHIELHEKYVSFFHPGKIRNFQRCNPFGRNYTGSLLLRRMQPCLPNWLSRNCRYPLNLQRRRQRSGRVAHDPFTIKVTYNLKLSSSGAFIRNAPLFAFVGLQQTTGLMVWSELISAGQYHKNWDSR